MEILIKKLGKTFTIEADKLPENSREAIFEYGLKQMLNDCHSGVKDAGEVEARVEAKITALNSGTITIRNASSNPLKPLIEAIATDMRTYLQIPKKIGLKKLTQALSGADGENWESRLGKVVDALAKCQGIHSNDLVMRYRDVLVGKVREDEKVDVEALFGKI